MCAKCSRIFAPGSIALFVALGVAALRPAPAQAGQWSVVVHAEGATRYENTVNDAWEALKEEGPDGPPEGATKKWSVPEGERGVSEVVSFVNAPTSAALWQGNLGDIGHYTVDPRPMHSDLEASGSISVELHWVPTHGQEDTDLAPSTVRVVENASASSWVGLENTTHPFDSIQQEAKCGLPGAHEESGGIGFPWKKSSAHYVHVVNNPGNSDVVHIPTRHLKAFSKGTAGDPLTRLHGVDVSYNVSVPDIGAAGSASLVLLKEIHHQDTGQTELVDVGPWGDGAADRAARVGARVWAGMEFDVYPKSRLAQETRSVQLHVKEEKDPKLGDDQHPESENHVDPVLPLTPTSQGGLKWQKRVGSSGQWQDTSESFSTPNTGGDLVFYRVLWPWDTHKVTKQQGTTLYDHNGAHTVSLLRVGGSTQKKIRFEGVPDQDGVAGGNTVSNFPDRKADVENLVITDVSTSNGTSDYFKFDPKADANSPLKNPTITFTVNDDGNNRNDIYRWRVRVRGTEHGVTSSDDVIYTGEAQYPDVVNVSVVDGQVANDSPKPRLGHRGAYNFDISVAKFTDSNVNGTQQQKVDSAVYRSKLLFVPDKMPAPNSMKAGFSSKMMSSPQGGSDMKASYFLRDESPSNHAKVTSLGIDLIPPSLGEPLQSASDLDTTLNTTHLDVPLHHFSSDEMKSGGGYLALIYGKDDHALLYRDHTPRSMLAQNEALLQVEFGGQVISGSGQLITSVAGLAGQTGVS